MSEIKIPLTRDTISKEDMDSLSDWIKTYPKLTKGPETELFEKEWSNWIGSKYSLFCNSGSSANLLMLYALIVLNRLNNKKVVVPALSWATDLSPVIQLGLEPILCDCNSDNLSVDLDDLEKIFKEENPSALILVSVLGLPPNMDRIVNLCKKYNVILLEDACESLGTEFGGKKLGTFGSMSSFSMYFSHHISTIEGGMICTDDEELYEVLKSIRSHGWDRDSSEGFRKKLRDKWGVSEFNGLYTFYYPGFNLRSTDLQAFIGRKQLLKLDDFCKKRSDNFNLFQSLILKSDVNPKKSWKPSIQGNCFVSNFCYPIIHLKRDEIIKDLYENGVESRPLICGSMGSQPMYIEKYGRKDLTVSSMVDKYGFYVPNNPYMNEEEIKIICDIVNKHTV